MVGFSRGTVYNRFKDRKLQIRSVKETITNRNLNLDNHPNWRGGLYYDKIHNRILRCVGKGKYMQESVYQYLLSHKLKSVPKGFVIHHKDNNKLNNSVDNLEMLSRSQHTILHNKRR